LVVDQHQKIFILINYIHLVFIG